MATLSLSSVVGVSPVEGQAYKALHKFAGPPSDGANPYSGVIRDSTGNLYGTTMNGGAFDQGAVFKLDKAGAATVMYSFTGGADGKEPIGGLIRDSTGNLYGTTHFGGASNNGVVFEVDASGKETVLYGFGGAADGGNPEGGLIRDSTGNLYGTTLYGGARGYGVVFKVDTNGNETVLFSFSGAGDGGYPYYESLVRDSTGNLYGTTCYGGIASGYSGYGIVFELDASGNETVLYSFTGGADGGNPVAGLTRDAAGNLYGTTLRGGASGSGVVFRLDTSGAETVLYSFTGGADGKSPVAGVILDPEGNLYGTTLEGGLVHGGICRSGCGVVFEVDTTGNETVLHSFTGYADGLSPWAGLLRDRSGGLYGTTMSGGAGRGRGSGSGAADGVVFRVKP